MLPKRRRLYVPGPRSQVGSVYKGNSTSWEEPAGFPFDTGAVLLCANLNAKCADSQGKTKNKVRNKCGDLSVCHPDPLPQRGRVWEIPAVFMGDHGAPRAQEMIHPSGGAKSLATSLE